MNHACNQFDPPLDAGIAGAVAALCDNGVETFESCQGGSGHAYPEPTVRFHGDMAEGFRALAAAMKEGLPVAELRKVWPVQNGEPTGPWWEITFATVPIQLSAQGHSSTITQTGESSMSSSPLPDIEPANEPVDAPDDSGAE